MPLHQGNSWKLLNTVTVQELEVDSYVRKFPTDQDIDWRKPSSKFHPYHLCNNNLLSSFEWFVFVLLDDPYKLTNM